MCHRSFFFFFFNDTATTEIYTLSLHDALPIPLRSQLENQWMRIRNNLFDDRSWFARSAKDVDALRAEEDDARRAKTPVTASPPAPLLLAHTLEGRWTVRELYGNG